MKRVFYSLSLCASLVALNSCTPKGGGGSASIGPWDENGNYIEGIADDPSKWRRSGGSIASNDRPPPDATPLSSGGSPSIALPPSRPLVDSSRPKPKVTDSPRVVSSRSVKPSTSRSTVSSRGSKPSSSGKKTVAKTKKAPAPKVVRHTVKRGDSLSSLAKRYGTSVSAIQRANGLSGTMIRDGKSLVIPKK